MPDMPIHVTPDDLEAVLKILRENIPEYEVWAFGSRLKGTAEEFSDLDLAVITDKPLDALRTATLREHFTESDLPFKVDIIDWALIDKSFKDIIQNNYTVVQQAEDAN